MLSYLNGRYRGLERLSGGHNYFNISSIKVRYGVDTTVLIWYILIRPKLNNLKPNIDPKVKTMLFKTLKILMIFLLLICSLIKLELISIVEVLEYLIPDCDDVEGGLCKNGSEETK